MNAEFLRAYAAKVWPNAEVVQYAHCNFARVWFDVDHKTLARMSHNVEATLRELHAKLDPHPVRKRRLHWGKRK